MTIPARPKILLDSGTSYSKLYFIDSGTYDIIPSRQIKETAEQYEVVAATGHNAHRFTGVVVNELIALARGAKRHVIDLESYTVVDCGSRDIKYIQINNGVIAMDWNAECGAFCGQIVELLERHFQFDSRDIDPAEKPIALTCGILGMTRMFDLIADDCLPQQAFARFIKGLADNVYQFAKKPATLFISGGLCDNPLFMNSFHHGNITGIGRFVLVDGLRETIGDTGG